MAIRQLMLSKKIEQRKANLAELLTQEEAFNTRSAELEKALEEAKTDEEIAAVEEEVNKLEGEQTELDGKKSTLEGEIAGLEGELEQLNANEPKNEPAPVEPIGGEERNKIIKGDERTMARAKFFKGMERAAVQNLIEREDVKEFLTRTREFISQKRAVTGGELGIPVVFLEVLRDNLNKYSKLVPYVMLKPIAGKARQNIIGQIPEGVWTEAIGKINELTISFNQFEVDGYKVGGFIAIPNSLLEDSSDIDLANEIMYSIGQAIGFAIDKAILYGTGVKMPVGILKRLAETAKPAYWGDKEPTWTDLHTSNLLLIDPAADTDVKFYKDLILKLGKVKSNYAVDNRKFWAMSTKTKNALIAKALTINAAGAIVSGQNDTMPIVGGDIVTLDFIPDNVVIGGHGCHYLLVERAGAALAQSTEVQFIEDNTVFKGTARYDGRPIFGEGFVALNISQDTGATVPSSTAVTFVADTANA